MLDGSEVHWVDDLNTQQWLRQFEQPMSKYIRIIEQQIETVKGYIERGKRVGCYHDNCVVWAHHITAYEQILDLINAEVKRSKAKSKQR